MHIFTPCKGKNWFGRVSSSWTDSQQAQSLAQWVSGAFVQPSPAQRPYTRCYYTLAFPQHSQGLEKTPRGGKSIGSTHIRDLLKALVPGPDTQTSKLNKLYHSSFYIKHRENSCGSADRTASTLAYCQHKFASARLFKKNLGEFCA